jgi:hypothetical protein
MLFEEFKEFKEFWRRARRHNPGASTRMMIQTAEKKAPFVEVISNSVISVYRNPSAGLPKSVH